MKTHNFYLYFWAFTLVALSTVSSFAQKKVLGIPVLFEMPVDHHPDEKAQKDFLEGTMAKSTTKPWLVFSDREDNRVFDKAEGKETGKRIGFREPFYVVDEKPEWIKIVKAVVNKLTIETLKEDVGWVRKADMLLWAGGLIDRKTQIHKKVLLLNRLDAFSEVSMSGLQKEAVEVFKGPKTGAKIDDLPIFSFYFVLKKEGNMFLIATDSELSEVMNDRIIGWVKEQRCSNWDNRVCLEPNFEVDAFAERKDVPALRIRAFRDSRSAQAFAESGVVRSDSDVYWDEDPVKLNPDKLAKSNPRRFSGKVMRFPMAGISPASDGNQYFRSGLIGTIQVAQRGSSGVFKPDISEVNYSSMLKYIDQLRDQSQRVNVFFVIEGTSCAYEYKQQLVEALNSLKKGPLAGSGQARYGALLYRDLAEEKVEIGGRTVNRLREVVSLTSNFDKVVEFLSNADYSNKRSTDDWTALYYGVSESLKLAGFNENELNIIMLIGCFGDFYGSRIRREDPTAQAHAAYFPDRTPIIASLGRYNAHLYAIQLLNNNSNENKNFARASQALILESAKYSYIQSYGNNKSLSDYVKKELKIDEIPQPSMDDIGEDTPLKGSTQPGRLLRPSLSRKLPPSQLVDELTKNVQGSVSFVRKRYQLFYKIFYEDKSMVEVIKDEPELNVDAGVLLPAVLEILHKIGNDKNVSSNDLYNALQEKHKLFAEVYIPQKIKGAVHPSMSYSLLMPEKDLIKYIGIIEKCLITESNYRAKRERLQEIYTTLVEQFSGDKITKRDPCMNREDVFRIMQGLEKTGLELKVSLNVRICDISNEKKVSNQDIDNLIARFKTVHDNLLSISKLGDKHDFCYSSPVGNRYFWIPIQEAF